MNIIYIDSVTEWMVIGLYKIENQATTQISLIKERVPREGGVKLPQRLRELLQEEPQWKTHALLVVNGPGSFTGIRIGVSFARAYSQALQIPCMGIGSIELYSHYYFSKLNTRSLVLLDGRMKKVYGGATSENGFEICVDLPYEEAISKIGIENSKVITDFHKADFLNIEDDFPEPLSFIKKINSTILSLNYKDNNYKHLLPNYMRGTYVDGKKV
jgi:tRNA threonylcarbamoyladenosine biosynthesis protein TsaB